MESQYDHKKYEEKIYDLWEKSKSFKPSLEGRSFSIIMPPPNANDPLHIGHAMFITIEDILIRFHRMLGDSTLWLPGTDHAGIETQFVFEKKLAKNNQSRFNFDRDTLYKMIWNYVQKNSGVAIDQMKKIGASADWDSFKFTLDKDIIAKVLETFISLNSDGLIYRGEKLINYCTKCGTGYSELEVVYEEKNSLLYYVKYYFADEKEKYVTVATTRPEPIYVDTHLAINPKNKKTKHLKGQKVINPLTGSVMEIIEDSFVKPDFGTGVVKLTPAHDQIDFEVAQKHNLPITKAIGTNGKMIGGPCDGMKISLAREETTKILTKKGCIEKIDKNYINRVGTCYRCRNILEPIPLAQFFIKTKPLVEGALKALDSKETVILGAGQEKILRHWLSNIKDWNISRQIVWGIRIPVWYKVDTNEQKIAVNFINNKGEQFYGTINQITKRGINDKNNKKVFFNLDDIKDGLQQIIVPIYEGKNEVEYKISIDEPKDGNWIQETDTFDTWFSSGQWPVVTLQTNKNDYFNKFYPTTVIETGYDILPIWVMRMMILGIYTTGKSPFKAVYLHGLVRDEKGRKMSKSIGNVINPLEIVEKYGADALRFALVVSSTPAQDKRVGENSFRAMRNFSNKIWNAARFVKDFENEVKDDPSFNLWCQKELPNQITKLLTKYKVGLAAEKLYNDFWHKFCDVEIEKAKDGKVSSRQLKEGLLTLIKLLHPFVPFVTEAIFKEVFAKNENDLLVNSTWIN